MFQPKATQLDTQREGKKMRNLHLRIRPCKLSPLGPSQSCCHYKSNSSISNVHSPPPIFKRFCITFGFPVKKHGDLSTPIADCWAKTQACPIRSGKMQEWNRECRLKRLFECSISRYLKYPQQELSWLCSKNLQGPWALLSPTLDKRWTQIDGICCSQVVQ